MTIQFSNALQAKQLRDFFQEHGRIHIMVDATREDVDVPPFLKGDPALRLVLNSRMPQPIYIRDDALESNFSFSGTPYACHIPISAIWAAYQPDNELDQGLVWENCVPETIRVIVNAARGVEESPEVAPAVQEQAQATEPTSAPAEKKRRHLRVVK